MNEGIITNRYAKALFHAGEDEGKTENIKADIDAILDIVNNSDEFIEFLDSPIIKVSVKQKMFEEIFNDKIDKITLTFLLLMAKNKRENFLKSTCLQFLQFYKEKQGIKEAIITTAHPLNSEHRKEINAYIKKQFKVEVDLIESIDASMLGGFKLRIEDQQIDASVASKLKTIKTELIKS